MPSKIRVNAAVVNGSGTGESGLAAAFASVLKEFAIWITNG